MKSKQNSLSGAEQADSVETVNITYHLTGDEARSFNQYKKRQYLRNNAEAARKLMLERLAQVEQQQPDLATT